MANAFLKDLQIKDRPISSLKHFVHNARTHSTKQLHQIAASIREFGFTNPILIDQSNVIIAGYGRVEAAKILGLDQVPTIQIEHLTEAQKRAYVIADNKLAENAGWDPDILAIEFQHLSSIDLNFELEITGFDTAEIDLLVDGAHKPYPDAIEDRIPSASGSPVTKHGDLWVLGDHRIICGDARDAAVFEQLMAGDIARLVFTDPPYNVPIDGHVCGLGAVKHREFAMASGEMTGREFTAFLHTIFMNAAEVSADGAIHFKRGVRYRFYVSSAILSGRRDRPGSASRVAAPDLERVITSALREHFANSGDLTDHDLIVTHIERIALGQTNILITLKVGGAPGNMIELARSRQPASPRARIENDENLSIEEPNVSLVHAIARAHLWLKALSDGKYQSVEELAEVAKWNPKVIRKALRLAFLAPDIIQAIVLGSQPKSLSVSELQGVAAHSWHDQRRLLGFPFAA